MWLTARSDLHFLVKDLMDARNVDRGYIISDPARESACSPLVSRHSVFSVFPPLIREDIKRIPELLSSLQHTTQPQAQMPPTAPPTVHFLRNPLSSQSSYQASPPVRPLQGSSFPKPPTPHKPWRHIKTCGRCDWYICLHLDAIVPIDLNEILFRPSSIRRSCDAMTSAHFLRIKDEHRSAAQDV